MCHLPQKCSDVHLHSPVRALKHSHLQLRCWIPWKIRTSWQTCAAMRDPLVLAEYFCPQEVQKVMFLNLKHTLKVALKSLSCHQKGSKLLGEVSPSSDLEALTVCSLFIPIPARVCNVKNKLLSMEVGTRYLHS